jgi:hypothetical protein
MPPQHRAIGVVAQRVSQHACRTKMMRVALRGRIYHPHMRWRGGRGVAIITAL